MHIWVRRQSASTSAARWPRVAAPGDVELAGRAPEASVVRCERSCSRMVMMCCTKAVPRSKRRVTFATRQPSFSSPMRFAIGHAGAVEEDLAEVAVALEGVEGADVHAGLVHRQDQPGDALVLRQASAIGADEELAVVGDVGAGAPDLVAFHHVVVARRGQARVRRAARSEPASGSEKPWHQTCVALEDGGQVGLLLRLGALGHDGRAAVHDADEVRADVGCVRRGRSPRSRGPARRGRRRGRRIPSGQPMPA